MIIPEGFAHVGHKFRGDAVPTGAMVTYGVQLGLAPGPVATAEDLHGIFADAWLDGLGPSILLEETLVRFGPSPEGPSGSWVQDRGTSNTGTMTSPAVALLVRKTTGMGGRKNRGRFYLPGLIEGAVNEAGVVFVSTMTMFQGFADSFLAALVTNSTPMVILHNGAEAPTPVTKLMIDGRAATQRKRQRR